ncbi:MAG TPA: HEAT repeat domain-containing protein [Candidatus Norongarragalinales archaeon]|jgi:HEAT repeat protein|nr:HEAT repeat domain-containing protein [Candidatus Norongarragalinales archaeon]
MSKLEKFFTIGHPKLVIKHLKKAKKPELFVLALDHGDPKVYTFAHKQLELLGAPAIPFFLKRLAIPHGSVRSTYWPIHSLGKIGEASAPHALEILKVGWEDYYWGVTGKALKNIGPKAGPYLLPAITDANATIRRRAASALGQIGYKEALPHLKHRLRFEKAWFVRKQLKDAIKKLERVR